MSDAYLEVISFIGRVHRQFLEVVKLELDGMGIRDINNVQAMVLFNIGEAEMTVGELTLRGCYLGSNVSYNVKKMVEQGYLAQRRSVHDRRSVHVQLTEKGQKLRDGLTAVHRRHVNMLADGAVSADDLQTAEITLRRSNGFGAIPASWRNGRHSAPDQLPGEPRAVRSRALGDGHSRSKEIREWRRMQARSPRGA